MRGPETGVRQCSAFLCTPMEAVTVAVSGVSAPRRSVTSSRAPAAVTAATTDTASPPRPLWLLPGSCRAASGSTASGTGHTAKVVTIAGRSDVRPERQDTGLSDKGVSKLSI